MNELPRLRHRVSRRSLSHWFCIGGLLALLLMLPACSPKAGSLTIESQQKTGSTLKGRFNTGYYRFDDRNQITIVLLEGSPEAPTQAVTMRMFWHPRPGRTPIDPTATNATLHYVIFTGKGEARQAGIYSGAGFVFPSGEPGKGTLKMEVWQSTLRLTDATEQFVDLLGPASLVGDITIRQDDVALERTLRQLNITIREVMGYPRLVKAEDDNTPPL